MKPSEQRIQEAHVLINTNIAYLEKIPRRQEPIVPAYIAAKFTYGYCNVFATALQDIKGFKAIALIAHEYKKMYELSKIGYVHSFNIDKEGHVVDIWGKDNMANIASRFGISKYTTDVEEHEHINNNLKRSDPEKYFEIKMFIFNGKNFTFYDWSFLLNDICKA